VLLHADILSDIVKRALRGRMQTNGKGKKNVLFKMRG